MMTEEELKSMETTVDAVMKKARGAVDDYFDVFQKTMGMNPWSGTELVDKAQRFSAQNIHATFEFMNKLAKAKDFQDVVRIQTEFMQAQMGSFTDQFRALGENYTKSIGSVVKAAAEAARVIPVKGDD